MACWAWLPELVLDLIIHKLPSLPDCVRFGSVCRPWRIAAKSAAKQRRLQFPAPMLLYPTVNPHSYRRELVLYSVQENKPYRIHFPFIPRHNPRFFGFSFGWLVLLETDFSITLFKPTPKHKPQRPIRLPPISDGPGPCMPSKVMLSADPTTCDTYVVVALYGESRRLAIFRSGDHNWTYTLRQINLLCDALWLNNKLYVVTQYCNVLQIDGVSTSNLLTSKLAYSGIDTGPKPNPHIHLMESSRGQLLLIVSYFNLEDYPDTITRDLKVEELKDGPLIFFVGENCSVVDESADINDTQHIHMALVDGRCVFSLQTINSQTHNHSKLPLKILPPIWITPLLYDNWPPIWINPMLSDDWI